ncbi:MAG TPA: hypothetical protein DCZ94_03030 [Lentisphaeria bacterium]|nr:MAG: hypothetical protein A2X48_15855 [Lentisphaerae bacterium GWF2_49_21]HBC85908.1 hypothetical protein [Lentisphaeria bacterium]
MFAWFQTKTFTDSWGRKEPLNLVVDLKDNSVCGVKLGHSIHDFSFLGPSEKPKSIRSEKTLYYLSLGISLGFDERNSRFCDFRIVWSDYLEEGFTPYRGSLLFSGKHVGSQGNVSRQDVLAILGEPYGAHRDSEEEIVFYDTSEYEWQFEFDLQGQLKQLIVTDAPLLAEDRQRDLFGIRKPWPPSVS